MEQATLKRRLISAIAIAMSVFHIYTGVFGTFEVAIQTGVHLTFAMALILLVRPTEPFAFLPGKTGLLAARAFDIVIAAMALVPMAWRMWSIDYLTTGRFEFVTPVTPLEAAMGLAAVIAILELCRRETGWPLAGIVVVVLAFPFVSGLPWIFRHSGYTLGQSVDAQFLTLAGIFGLPLSASAEYIILFIICFFNYERGHVNHLLFFKFILQRDQGFL